MYVEDVLNKESKEANEEYKESYHDEWRNMRKLQLITKDKLSRFQTYFAQGGEIKFEKTWNQGRSI